MITRRGDCPLLVLRDPILTNKSKKKDLYMSIYAQPTAAATAALFLTKGALFSVAKGVTVSAVTTTAFGIEKQVTNLSNSIANSTAGLFGSSYENTAFDCINIFSSIALTALAFYSVVSITSTALSFVAVPVAALSIQGAIIAAIFSRSFDSSLFTSSTSPASPTAERPLLPEYDLSEATRLRDLPEDLIMDDQQRPFSNGYIAKLASKPESYLFFVQNPQDGNPSIAFQI